MGEAVTINEIARQLGLSRNTVAKALNGKYVPAKTRLLVLEKAKELNYKSLNTCSIMEASKKHRILILSSKSLFNVNFYIKLMNGIENYCVEKNLEVIQYTADLSGDAFHKFTNYLKETSVDGVIAVECFEKEIVTKLINLDVPICFTDFTAYSVNVNKQYDLICNDDERAISNLIKTLNLNRPINHISYVGDYRHCMSFRERYMGMLRGINAIGITHTKEEDILLDDSSFDYGSSEVLRKEILSLKNKPDLFICSNDFIARTVVNALKTLGRKIPEDAMVSGFDDTVESTAFDTQITSFNVNKEFFGIEAVRTLLERIENPTIPSRVITLTSNMVLRESTARKK